ncbi:MAG TPA: carboxypeptidase-like regulatory domain-containing protein, partial [Blastocatellia bacterium]|nr:carboxypeptidase-like regulatory domain-containing protein [Blastocatellia bacterium]
MHHYLSVVLLFASLSLGLRAEAREWGKELVFTSAHQATQPATAKITGLIQDHDESPLTDVSVLIERVGLEWRGWRVRSDDDGQFSIEVPTGEYRIVLEKYGFKRTEYTGIILKVGEVQRLSIKMEIGLCSHCDEILTANIPPVPTQDVSDIPQVLRQPRRKVRLDPLGSIQLPITYNAYREGSGVDYWYGYIEDAESRLRFQYTAGIVQSPFQSGSEQLVWE